MKKISQNMGKKYIACALVAMGMFMSVCFVSPVEAAGGRSDQTVFRQAMKNASEADRAQVKQIRDRTKTQIEQLRDSANAEIAKILGISVSDMPTKQKERD